MSTVRHDDEDDEDDGDAIGPALPPHLLLKRRRIGAGPSSDNDDDDDSDGDNRSSDKKSKKNKKKKKDKDKDKDKKSGSSSSSKHDKKSKKAKKSKSKNKSTKKSSSKRRRSDSEEDSRSGLEDSEDSEDSRGGDENGGGEGGRSGASVQVPPHPRPAAPSVTPAANSDPPAPPPPPRRRVAQGPAAPPPPPGHPRSAHNLNDDDDVVGPLPVPTEGQQFYEELERQRKLAAIEARAAADAAADLARAAAAPAGREEWMLVPPEPSRLAIGVGQEMKPRQFSKNAKPTEVDQSGWTALPGDKQQRAAAGAGAGKGKAPAPAPEPRQLTADEVATHEYIRLHTAASRGVSLMEAHAQEYVQGRRFEDEDVSRRPFDRDRDVVSKRMDGKARQDLVDGAKKLDSRFSHGSKSNFL
ncbi:hypothetical protein DFJ73DRAFT_800515 [Zopfochytrium polystomum]|nr:hypothetical protein DFJ73DRAFT_800515 [Zopfochytrium polystomum]